MAQAALREKWMEGHEVVFGEDVEERKETDFSRLFEKEKAAFFREGEIFKGKVVSIGADYVTVDIGYKQEGLVAKREFTHYDGTLSVKEGEEIEVYLEKLESGMGNLILSKDKAEIIHAWDNISEACEEGAPVKGTIVAKVKGGLSVDIGVKAFLPGSQIDLRPSRHLEKYIGQTMNFKVIKFNKKRGNIVLSRRAILQDERKEMRNEILGQIEEGMVVKGIVKNITDYGAFIDLGGIDGLLHITDMSWGRVKHPSNILTVGEEIEVKILKFDNEKERVSLGLKQIQENPWENVLETYEVGAKISGEIVSVKDYGIFVELADGIEGLVHVSEMSWVGAIKNPIKHFTVGENIEAQVLDVDIENKRISLGLKQLAPNPWDDLEEKYPPGTKVKGVIQSVLDFGLFVNLGEEVDALIHVSDVSWTRKNINLKNEFNEKDTIDAIVLSVDKEAQKFCLGIKQLEEDPWESVEHRFPIGTALKVRIARVTNFGAFVELESGIEGFVHVSELSEEEVEKPTDMVKKGDDVLAMVIGLDKEAKKMALSIKAASDKNPENLDDTSGEVTTAKFGDKLKEIEIDQGPEVEAKGD